MTKEPLILIIDDEASIRTFLTNHLSAKGYACEEAATAEMGLTLAASLNPDLILLDLGLPDLDGQEVVLRLRQWGNVPLIVISARDQEAEKVRALEAGADDYLSKPFGLDELAARVRVALRHRSGTATVAGLPQKFGDLVWDAPSRRVFLAGAEVHLTPVEYRLLGVMVANPGRILTHRRLLEDVWGLRSTEFLHYVRIAIVGLRKKLEPKQGTARFIHTESGTGYRFFE
ncbi:MAG TPA: response regulator [Spirochaetia bacterium]|nr:response regulator [Spirochaetia bacterium]